MDKFIGLFTVCLSLAGALITFGMLYGVIKTRQQTFSTELKELKSEFRGIQAELKLFRQSCSRLCRYAIELRRSENPDSEFPIIEDPE